jgi:hypothetical protein
MRKQYDFTQMKRLKNHCAGEKMAVGINLSPEVIDYFKEMATETRIPYDRLINLCLLDCVKKRKRLSMRWVA